MDLLGRNQLIKKEFAQDEQDTEELEEKVIADLEKMDRQNKMVNPDSQPSDEDSSFFYDDDKSQRSSVNDFFELASQNELRHEQRERQALASARSLRS